MSESPESNRGWAVMCLVTLVVLGAINIFLFLFVVPKFEQIFQDALPGKPLPGITLFIIAAHIPLALIALAWPIVGIIAFQMRKRVAVWIVGLGLLFFFVLVPITILALSMPMIPTVGMSDASPQTP